MIENFRPTKVWSLVTIAGFAFIVLFEMFMLLVAVGQVVNPESTIDLDPGDTVSVWLMVQGVIALLMVPVYVATIVTFLIWLNRSYKNLEPLRASYLKFSSGWAVGYWFIPILALFRPFQVVREIWWESDPEIPDGQLFLTESLHGAPTYMGVWWGFWLVSNVANRFASNAFDSHRPEDVFVGGVVIIIACALTMVAAVLAVMVVRDITARQSARYLAVRTLEEREALEAATSYQERAEEGWHSNE